MKDNEHKVTLKYQPLTAGKHEIYVAGDFNDWKPDQYRMKEKDGFYYLELKLPIGEYAYKFVVDGNWIYDENAEEFREDGFGGINSILIVGDEKEVHQLREIVLNYISERDIKRVALVGDFNKWNPQAHIMKKKGKNHFKLTLYLTPGYYHYKFVLNNNKWIPDPKNERKVKDGFGSFDSILVVDEKYPKVEFKKGDGKILKYKLHTSDLDKIISPLTADKFEFKTKTYKNDVEEVFLVMNKKKLKMQNHESDDTYDYYFIYIDKEKLVDEFSFYFVLKDGKEKLYYLQSEISKDFKDAFVFKEKLSEIELFQTPDWVKDGIFYQIFCDRFRNGKIENDPDFEEWYYSEENYLSYPARANKYHLIDDWYDLKGLIKSNGEPDHYSFYGGDIAGIVQKIDYLIDLGINVIYFNPLVKAESNHKYDTADYFRIDPHFGTNEEFKNLVRLLHENDIRVIVDFAFNHTGVAFFAFQDILTNGEKSKYFNWYDVKKIPNKKDVYNGNFNALDYYQCWWGHATLPDLHFDLDRHHPIENTIRDMEKANVNWDLVNYLLKVAEFWLKDMDIDGFRLDVPNEVPFWFWKLFRKKVKETKKDAYLVGEIWSNAEEWVNSKYFDAVMNYAYFKDPVLRFFVYKNCSANRFVKDIKPGLTKYPLQARQVMMNLLDSHDTFRVLELKKSGYRALKLAVIFQMTYVGSPHIWYGDEIGMKGGHDPDNRRPFNWKYRKDSVKRELREFYSKLIEIRKQITPLRRGKLKFIEIMSQAFSFKRIFLGEVVFVLINNSNKVVEFENYTSEPLKDILNNELVAVNGNKKITVEAHWARILV